MVALNKNTTDGTNKFVTTYYVRDPQGKVLAVIFPIYRRRGNFPLTRSPIPCKHSLMQSV